MTEVPTGLVIREGIATVSCRMTSNYLQNRPRLISDTECYPNYWCIGFKNPVNGKRLVLERTETQPLDVARLVKIVRNYTLVGFNWEGYDWPMILKAVTGATNELLKECSNQLIPNREAGEKFAMFRHWQFLEHHGLRSPPFADFIDLMEVSPGAAAELSLKLTGGRLHSRTMRDLPYHHTTRLSPYQIRVLRDEYMQNDLDVTHDLAVELDSQIQNRITMSTRWHVDLRSKSDAQIAETLLKKIVEERTGRRVYRPDVRAFSFKFETPEFVRFETPGMQEQLRRIQQTSFIVDSKGKMLKPPFLTKAEQIYIDDTPYQMGIGGLHSIESSVSHYSDDEFVFIDRDVKGYYPRNIINSGKNPKALGHHFQPAFQGFVTERDAAKAQIDICKEAGDMAGAKKAKDTSEGGKVLTNGTFGKTNQPGSVLYAPEMMLQTTMSGQLALCMAIEQLTMKGFKVVSANTDGIVTRVDRARRWLFEAIIFDWECQTGLQTEETVYKSLHMRDVNSYVAITEKGEVKVKGQYAQCGPGQPAAAGLKKAPDAQITSDAVVEYLKNGTPVEKTIRACTDVRKFVVVKRVDGGCDFQGEYLGKAVRWYYSTEVHEPLRYKNDGRGVGSSMGAMPIMTLPEEYEIPADIDWDWYIREAYARLEDAGIPVVDPALKGKSGMFLAHYEDQKTVHLIDASTGVAVCGKKKKSIRDTWVEVKRQPEGRGMCAKCRKANEL